MVKCCDCSNFKKHPLYDADDNHKEGHCLMVDGNISASSFEEEPEKEIKCCLFSTKKQN